MTFNTRPVPVSDSDSERCRNVLWQRIAQLRAELQIEPTVQLRSELGAALEELRSLGGET